MRSSTWRLEDLRNVILNLGFVGENLHTRQIFDCKKMFDQYPNASVSMTVTPPEGEPYPGTIERDGDLVIWDVRDSDLVAEGDGEIQLVFTQEPHIARSYNARTHICRSQVPTGSIPSGLDDYITRADQLLDQVEDTFPAGGTTGQVLAKKSDTDYDTEWVDQGGGTEDYDELENRPQIGGVILTGNKTLHDLGAASEADVEAKYTKPETGIPASDLAAGVIPDPEDLIDDTAGDGDTDKVWSADKSHELLTEINHSYPSVSNMLADTNLIAGMMVKTQGFSSSGDGGGGTYLIVDSATTNAYDTFATENGKYAVLQHGGHVNAKQCGLTNNTYGGDAWFAFYNGTALSMDVNVRMFVSQTIQLNNTTEIYSSNKSELYYTGTYDAAVLSCFSGNGLSASEYQSTRSPKIHDLIINARNAKVGVCLVNIANTDHEIRNIYVYKGYVGFLFGQNWRNTFGLLRGEEQTYATFVQEVFPDATLSDFTAISDNGSINSCVFEYLLSTKSQNGALFDGYGSDNTILMIDVGLDLTDTEQSHVACRFKFHSGTINTIYCEHNNYSAASYTDLYVDNLRSYGDVYDYNKGLFINEIRGRRYYLNNNVAIGTLYIEDWANVTHLHAIDFSGGSQADRVTILHMPQGKFNGNMPYGVCGVAQELAKLKPEYELIETVEFASAAALSKSTKPNGDAYDFDSVYVEMTLPSNTTFPSCNIKFYDESNNVLANPYYSSVAADASNTKYAFIKVWNEKGFVWEEHGLFTTNGGSQTLIKAANTVYKSSAKIAKILSTQQMQTGTIVKIYAY